MHSSLRLNLINKADLRGLGASTVSCPRQAPTCGVIRCTYDQWFLPLRARRRYRQLPVFGKNMKRFALFVSCQLLLVVALVLLQC